jgi:hypothetical protein
MRRILAVALALALALAAAPATPATAKQKHRHAHKHRRATDPIPVGSDGRVGLRAALQVFAATIAPLPGVHPPKRGYPGVHDGSGPIRWVLAHWSQLTSAQQAAVQAALPGIAVPGAPLRAAAPRAHQASVGLAELQPMLDEARARLNFRLDPDLNIPATVELGPPLKGNVDAYAYTTGGPNATCKMVWAPNGQADTLEETRLTMLHELMHCYQLQLAAGDLPEWVAEGSPEWVSATLGAEWNPGYVSPVISSRWANYFATFDAPLTERSVTAIAFFAQLAASGVDVFKALPAIYAAPNAVDQAYDTLVDPSTGAGKLFLETASAAGLRRPALGPAWMTLGPMLPPAASARYDPITRVVQKNKLAGVKVIAKAYGNAAVRLTSTAEAVKVEIATPDSARGRIHAADGDHVLAPDTFLCGGTACTCPDGSAVSPLGDHAYVALFAHKSPAVVQLTPTTLDDACGHESTNLQVTGAFTATFDRQGSCALSTTSDPPTLSALFYAAGVGQVTLEIKRYTGPGTYQTGLDPPTGTRGGPSRAAVVKFGEPGGGSWGVDVSAEEPGTIRVDAAGPGGASGTVDTVSRSRDEPPTFVRVSGRWSCATAPGAKPPG